SSDFSISASPTSSTLIVNDPLSYEVYDLTITPSNFSSPLTYSANVQPSCLTASFGFNFFNQKEYLALSTAGCTAAAVANNYPIGIEALAQSGPVHTTSTLLLNLVDYSLSASPSSLTVNKGNAGTSSVTVTRNPSNGFSNNINFSTSLSPANSNITLSMNPTS